MVKDGGPAFPVLKSILQRQFTSEPHRFTYDAEIDAGMTLRDWFAGQALAGFIACDDPVIAKMSCTEIAERSYKFAAAMLAERSA